MNPRGAGCDVCAAHSQAHVEITELFVDFDVAAFGNLCVLESVDAPRWTLFFHDDHRSELSLECVSCDCKRLRVKNRPSPVIMCQTSSLSCPIHHTHSLTHSLQTQTNNYKLDILHNKYFG